MRTLGGGKRSCDPPGAAAKQGHAPPRHDKSSGPDEVTAAYKEVVSAAEERQREPGGVEGIAQIVRAECGAPEPVAGGRMENGHPGKEHRGGETEPQSLAGTMLVKQPCRKQGRGDDAGFFHQHQGNAGDGAGADAVLQEKQQGQSGEAHGRHVQLGEHRLGKEEGTGAEKGHGRESRGSARAAGQFDGEQKSAHHAACRNQQHGDPGAFDRVPEDEPEGGEAGHDAGRMNIGQGGHRYPCAGSVDIE